MVLEVRGVVTFWGKGQKRVLLTAADVPFLDQLMYYHFRKMHQAYAEVCVYTSLKRLQKLIDLRKKKH